MARHSEPILRSSTPLHRRLLSRIYVTLRKYPLLSILVLGCIGSVGIDLDHLLSETVGASRPLHIPFLFLVLCIVCYYLASSLRYSRNRIKEKEHANKTQ